ncbi:DUF4376 domain-containing protein [Agrobacterium rhizogenes]|nr:DUF4376 domain-containing protein [Rhizobium rhizogenes]NTF74520.1 DUF4376 domain-containing protein [Rhizobium rhizogenes]
MSNGYARIQDGLVVEIIELPDGIEVADAFHSSIVQSLVPCDSSVLAGYGYDGSDFSAPTVPPISKAELVEYANQKQWRLATGGYSAMVDGETVSFATDALSQSLITGKAVRLTQPNAPSAVNWQFGATFKSIAAADFLKVAMEIADFIQATFDKLDAILPSIEAGDIATTEEIDAVEWPLNSETVSG